MYDEAMKKEHEDRCRRKEVKKTERLQIKTSKENEMVL